MRKFWIDCLFATAFVFSTLAGIYKITDLRVFNAFDPLSQALGDMELTDIAFSQIRGDPSIDTNIVLVNIGYLSRREIAQQINIISQYNPKVIGMDGFFNCPNGLRDTLNCPPLTDPIGNLLLGNAIAEAGNVVLVTKVLQSDSLLDAGLTEAFDSIEHTDADLRVNAMEGFANLDTGAETQESFKTCRQFNPTLTVNGDRHKAFSVQVAQAYDSAKTQKILDRENYLETINYRGNIVDFYGASTFSGRYYVLDWDQVLDEQFLPGFIENKIVLFGFMGSDLSDTSWDDKFFTPLNQQYAGKTNPDMYGVVVHANIISMILNEDYIDELASWQQWVIAFILCYLNVALFSLIYQKIPDWFDGLSVLLQLLQIVLLSFLMIYILNWQSFKLDLTYTLLTLALVGTCFEIYAGVILKGVDYLKKTRWFTKWNRQVLNS